MEKLKQEIKTLDLDVTIISKDQATELIYNSAGKIFTAHFIKKDNSIRTMNARLNVTKYLKGGELGYDPETKSLVSCFDMQIQAYRMINLSTLFYLSIGGVDYIVL